MNEMTIQKPLNKPGKKAATSAGKKAAVKLKEHIVEIISDSGEGAQSCGQSLGAIAAQMGNGIWTTEIIPAEIRPPARSVAGASGNRIRIGSQYITNGGDETDLVVAFNEQVLLGRVRASELKPGCTILLESMWRTHADPKIVASYIETHDKLVAAGYDVREIPMEAECKKHRRRCAPRQEHVRAGHAVLHLQPGSEARGATRSSSPSARRTEAWSMPTSGCSKPGRNGRKPTSISATASRRCARPSRSWWSTATLRSRWGCSPRAWRSAPCTRSRRRPRLRTTCHDVFEKVGGMVHQAEDEIAACAFAIGASYAGKCTVTITSGPGYSLKQEGIGLAVMGEIPLVVVNVQRGGPSTGQPTKMEQGDLMAAIFGSHGDAPKVVMAPRHHRGMLLFDHHRAQDRRDLQHGGGGADRRRPRHLAAAVCAPGIQRILDGAAGRPEPGSAGAKPYDWDENTGLARRFIPGQPGGMHTLTGLAHDRDSHVAYDAEINEQTLRFRSLKLAALQKTLKAPPVFGDAKGDLLVIGWGSTKGAIEEAVESMRAEGKKVSSMHLQFLQPLPPGIKEIMQGFKKVMTIESNWSDRPEDKIIDETNRRYSSLAILLRARYLVDVDCWSEVKGQPIKPGTIRRVMLEKLKK